MLIQNKASALDFLEVSENAIEVFPPPTIEIFTKSVVSQLARGIQSNSYFKYCVLKPHFPLTTPGFCSPHI